MALTSAAKSVRTKTERTTRRRSGTQTQTGPRTNPVSEFSFLKHSFKNCWCSGPMLPDRDLIETSFYRSLSYLHSLYGFKIRKSKDHFPFNIAHDFNRTQKILLEKCPDLAVFITVDERSLPCVCTAEPYAVNPHTLYYVPIHPLHRIMHDKHRRPAAALLLKLCAYLYHALQIPYYRDTSSFLYDCYNVFHESSTNPDERGCDADDETIKENEKLYRQAKREGDYILRKIKQITSFDDLEKLTASFKADTDADKRILEVAQNICAIVNEFPGKSLQSVTPSGLIEPANDERILFEQYVSFFWDADIEPAYTDLIEYVSASVENYMTIDLPVGYQCFDTPHEKPLHDTRFPEMVFKAIEQLIDTLILLYEQYHFGI